MKKTKVTFNAVKLDYSCELMRALAHPLRLRILQFIDNQGVVNVNKIYNALKIEQSVTSQHLSVIKLAGVVFTEKNGKYVHCKINYDCVDRAQVAVSNFLANGKKTA